MKILHFIHLRAEICSEALIEELDEFNADDRVRMTSLLGVVYAVFPSQK